MCLTLLTLLTAVVQLNSAMIQVFTCVGDKVLFVQYAKTPVGRGLKLIQKQNEIV